MNKSVIEVKVTKFSFEIFAKIKVAESLNDIDLMCLNQNEIIQLENILTSNTSKFIFFILFQINPQGFYLILSYLLIYMY